VLLSENINSANLSYKNFRIKFEKTGVAKYISHLDLNRIFSRAIIRAEIKIAYSEGFNPHPKIAFVSALSLGTESFCEFVDIKIIDVDNVSESDIFNKLKNVFPLGINIKEAYAPNLDFKYIDSTRFYIFVKSNGFEAGELNELFSGDVFVEKKPGLSVNLKDYICEIDVSQDYNELLLVPINSPTGEFGGTARSSLKEYIKIDAVVKTNQTMFLNPENIIKGINSKYSAGDYFIQKVEMYDKDFKIFR